MVVEGVGGVHTIDFSSFECAGSFVQWKDYDYPWKTSDLMLAREARRHGRRPPVASSQAYPRHWDIVCFENPTRPPFLRGGQRPWRGQLYSPSELQYTPRPVSRPHRSKSHSPASGCYQHTPIMGVLMARPRDRSGLPSSSGSSLRMRTPSPPWMPRYAGPWIHGTRRYSSLTQQRIYPSSPPVPNPLTIPVLQLHRLPDGGTFFPF